MSLGQTVVEFLDVCVCGIHQALPLSAENHWDNYKAIHIQTLSGSLAVGIHQLWEKLIAI